MGVLTAGVAIQVRLRGAVQAAGLCGRGWVDVVPSTHREACPYESRPRGGWVWWVGECAILSLVEACQDGPALTPGPLIPPRPSGWADQRDGEPGGGVPGRRDPRL